MAVALVALFGLFGAYRALLPIANDLQPVYGNPELDQKIFGSGGPPIAETEVVFRRPALVTVALYRHQESRVVGKNLL